MKNITKSVLLCLLLMICSHIEAQVNMVASTNAVPPLSVGQTFNYVLEAESSGTPYTAAQVKITYNPTLLQVNSLTNGDLFPSVIINNTSTSGVIEYVAGSAGNTHTGNGTIFTVEFQVLNGDEAITIVNDTNPTDGAYISDPNGVNVLGTTNDIVLESLSINTLWQDQLQVHPNPANEDLYIQLSDPSKVSKIHLYSLEGKLVKTFDQLEYEGNQIHLQLQHLKSAFYLVKVISHSNEQATFKIMISH